MNTQFNISGVTEDQLSDPACELAFLVSLFTYRECCELISQTNESIFTIQTHVVLFRAMKKLHEKGEPIDEVTIMTSLKTLGTEKQGVNEKYILDLFQNAPVTLSNNVSSYLGTLQDLAIRRNLRDAGNRIQKIANDLSNGTADDAIAKANSVLSDIGTGTNDDDPEPLINSLVDLYDEVNKIQTEKMEGTYAVRGVNTGFIALDNKIGEIQNGDLVIVAARPSMGKTAFAQNISTHITTNLVKPVLFESIEMKKKKISRRITAAMGSVELKRMQNGTMEPDDWTGFADAVKLMQQAPFEIKDGVVTLADIRRHARKTKVKFGTLGAIFIDYLQLIATPHLNPNISEHERLTVISKGLKNIAMEFDCPVFALSQLSRDVDKRPNKRPVMSDLRGSGAIEQDADVILFLYRDEYYNKDKSQFKGMLEVIASKVRDGETGETFLFSELQYSRFSNVSNENLEYFQKQLANVDHNQKFKSKVVGI